MHNKSLSWNPLAKIAVAQYNGITFYPVEKDHQYAPKRKDIFIHLSSCFVRIEDWEEFMSILDNQIEKWNKQK